MDNHTHLGTLVGPNYDRLRCGTIFVSLKTCTLYPGDCSAPTCPECARIHAGGLERTKDEYARYVADKEARSRAGAYLSRGYR